MVSHITYELSICFFKLLQCKPQLLLHDPTCSSRSAAADICFQWTVDKKEATASQWQSSAYFSNGCTCRSLTKDIETPASWGSKPPKQPPFHVKTECHSQSPESLAKAVKLEQCSFHEASLTDTSL